MSSLRASTDHHPVFHRVIARVMRAFTKVHPEEAGTVVLMTLAAFLLLTAYYLLKTVREPLILLQGGAEVKLYARAAQAVLMVGRRAPLRRARAPRRAHEAARDRVPVLHLEPRALRGPRADRRPDRPAVLPVGRRVQLHGGRAVLGARRRHLHRRAGQAPVPDHRRPAARSARSSAGCSRRSLVPFGPHAADGRRGGHPARVRRADRLDRAPFARIRGLHTRMVTPTSRSSDESAWHLLARDRYLCSSRAW